MWTSLTCAVATTPVQFITNVTFTSKKSRDILAASIDTDVSKGTFIYVCKRTRDRMKTDRERAKERKRERPSCEGLVDHGIMVENWQPAIGSEGRSPLLKNDSSGTKKCPDISRQTHIHYASSSQGYEIGLFHIIRHCVTHYCLILPELRHTALDRLFQDV